MPNWKGEITAFEGYFENIRPNNKMTCRTVWLTFWRSIPAYCSIFNGFLRIFWIAKENRPRQIVASHRVFERVFDKMRWHISSIFNQARITIPANERRIFCLSPTMSYGFKDAAVPWLNWIEQPPPKGQVIGSNPIGVTTNNQYVSYIVC